MNQNKPLWTATNEEGEKFFYYPQLGWVSAATGNVVGFDISGAAAVKCPVDATHILIEMWNGYSVQFLRHNLSADIYAYWNGSDWMFKPDAPKKPSGHLTKLNWSSTIWFDNRHGDQPPKYMDRLVEVEIRAGTTHERLARKFAWTHTNNPCDIVRWRYVG